MKMDYTDRLLTDILQREMRREAKRTAAKPAVPLSPAVFDYRKPLADTDYRVGFGKEIILPPDIEEKTYYIAGYRENNPARGVLDPPFASALWLDDSTGRGGVLLITLDAVGLLYNDVLLLRKRLNVFCKWSRCRDIHVFCTHNHAGIDTMGIWGKLPFSGKNPKYMQLVFDAAKKAAYKAYNTQTDGRLWWSRIKVPDMQYDNRTPVVYSDMLTKVRFVPKNGSREIWFLNFASHSESLQGCNRLVSADFPAYLRQRISSETNAEVFYTVGAVGGMITMALDNEALLRKEHRLNESTRRIGEKLAGYAMQREEETCLSAGINLLTQPFYCPVQNPVLTLASKIGLLNATPFSMPGKDDTLALKTQVSYIEIGELKLLLLPCELFPELAYGGYLTEDESATGLPPQSNPTPLIRIVGEEKTVIIGLADDELGYVIPPNDFFLNEKAPYRDKAIDRFGRRHYEETNSVGPVAAVKLAEATEMIFNTVQAVKNKEK